LQAATPGGATPARREDGAADQKASVPAQAVAAAMITVEVLRSASPDTKKADGKPPIKG
jgi:hypothetical protein